jgi:hypothetical protein
MSEAGGLRLTAQDEEDLRALSAAVQDAVAKVGDLVFDPRKRAFTAVLNRYRWEEADRRQRVRAALRVEAVERVRARGMRLGQPGAVVNLLAVEFRPDGEPPGGALRLIFSGGGEIEAAVECIDVSLMDLTRPWRARGRPRHEGG